MPPILVAARDADERAVTQVLDGRGRRLAEDGAMVAKRGIDDPGFSIPKSA